ncbi:TetR family transcriptional regulator [Arcicella sp. LKC2W]|uniref:TetR/AcrR family transcriptional regulator n=1 Tax=Arcicella sp. LKC2W TaxID=2984198 RepID=UPI002B1F4466|nr:TetR family transcriptional regulator [Arcicella sp. LKC2W]MEA5460448.1 TetR family transcriptional regulator [Arcicella sp. LKC2W]
MNCSNKSAEEKIKIAAIKVFLEKGFDGTTIRDIAKEADLNCALMNYYFRSKEKLFRSVFEDMIQLFFKGILEIFNQPISLRNKLNKLIDHDFEMFKNNPKLANFVLNELTRNPERFLETLSIKKVLNQSFFEKQVLDAIKSGEIRDISAVHIMLLLKSNIQFIFQSRIMTTQIWGMTDEDFDIFAANHKEIIKEMIGNYLFGPADTE